MRHDEDQDPVQLPTREGYDLWSQIYDEEDNPLIALDELHVPGLLGEVEGLRVADIGCGTGRRSLPMAAAGAEVTAVDFSDGMLARARARSVQGRGRVRFVRADVTRPLPLATAAFDRVTSFLVFDHVQRPAQVMAELARICRPRGGFVLISVMHPAIMLRGIQAQFTDPATGRKTRPASAPNQISDYVMAAAATGLELEHISEHVVDDALAARSPRAHKLLGWPLLLLLRLRPRGNGSQ